MSERKPWTGKTVYIVDDSKSIRMHLTKTYQDLGFRVAGEAADGVEALEALTDLDVDIVSIDMMMPVMHGVEFYRRLKAIKEFKFVFVSCLNTDYRTREAFIDEIDPILFVSKPIVISQLTSALAYAFEGNSVSEPALEEDISPSQIAS